MVRKRQIGFEDNRAAEYLQFHYYSTTNIKFHYHSATIIINFIIQGDSKVSTHKDSLHFSL